MDGTAWLRKVNLLDSLLHVGRWRLTTLAVPIGKISDQEWLDRHPDGCRSQMQGNRHTSNDPWAEISMQHPQQAALRPRIHRQIVLVAEKKDATEPNGIAIARLESGREPCLRE